METENSPSQQPVPRQPQPGMRPRPMQPTGHRPMIDGFSPRRPSTPPSNAVRRPAPSMDGMSAPTPAAPMRPFATRPAAPVPAAPATPVAHAPAPQRTAATHHFAQVPPSQQPKPFATRPMALGGMAPKQTGPQQPTEASDVDMPPASKARPPKEHNGTGHAGLVGLAAFVVFGALLLSPIVPGKISQSFPLSSSSETTGQQSIDCLSNESNLTNTTKYTSKVGSPITYTSGTSTTQSVNCGGQEQSAIVATASQFNPLGLLLDLVVALAIAIIIARVWRLVFGEKRFKPRKREEN